MAVTTLSVIIAAVAVAAAGVGTYSAIQEGQAQEKAAKYSAGVDRNNAIIASNSARYEAERQRKRNVLLRGKQRAAYSKSGVEISGSPDDVIYDSEIEGRLDVLSTRYSSAITSRDLESRARLKGISGQQAITSSYFNAGSSILGGVGNAAGSIRLRDNPSMN